MNRKHIAIVGLGGVGGYFGFKINQANEDKKQYQITFVARDKTYETVKNNGLILLSDEHPNSVTKPDFILDTIKDVSSPDLILLCTKEYDLENICKDMFQIISPNTIILPMMNGADIYERIRKIIPKNTILPSYIYVASHIKEKGIIEHKGKPGKIFIGRDPENFTENIDWILDLLSKSGIDFDLKDNSFTEIWTKFIFIASFGLVTSKYNSSIGQVCSDPLQRSEAEEIMKEIKVIADQKGFNLDKDIIAKTFEKATTFPPQTPTSLQLDINSNKEQNELQLFASPIINYGIELNIETPFTEKIYTELKEKIDLKTFVR
ncbi:ketopantoate reductase family protein [Flavobacterium branchiicola]|uniref:2-dehydropantoate 2-reductase n=1 Tax=Flavobacterium branchiicola TaxID=1114875 RepID=A0ABV9PA82_9FLAO|nr:2-dehydropantoate 2-reductase [Flavobacterium branchiicola]MBS7252600.1 ketopantoate reductase family protein [Flavobacterium branchiicola]